MMINDEFSILSTRNIERYSMKVFVQKIFNVFAEKDPRLNSIIFLIFCFVK